MPKSKKQLKKEESETESDVTETESEVETETESEDDSDNKDTSKLKEAVSGYLKVDDEIRIKREEIKELQEKKIIYEEFIAKYLETENKTKIETNDGEIVFKKQTSKTPLKEELIEEVITKQIKDSGMAHTIMEEVGKLRGVNIKNNIRRIKKKATKKSK